MLDFMFVDCEVAVCMASQRPARKVVVFREMQNKHKW